MCSLLILLGFSITVTRAQLAIRYSRTATTGTYSSISGTGTAVPSLAADNAQSNLTGLAAMTINGTSYTNARVSSNGWLVLYSSTAPTSTTESGILSTPITNGGVCFAPMNADLHISTAGGTNFYYQTIGNENIYEWYNFSRYASGGGSDVLNFQIRMNTSTGEISFVYGTTTIGSLTGTFNVGWKTTATGSTWATNINNLMIDVTGSPNSCNWSDAVSGNSNTSSMYLNAANSGVAPVSGLTYTWAPQNTVDPVRTFSAVASISATGATVSWTAPTGASQYNVRYRAVGSCSWTNHPGNPVMTNSAVLSGLSFGTNYQYQVQASDGTNNTIWSHIPLGAGAGTNGYVATGSFTTAFPCAGTPTALGSNTITPNSANITWTAASPAPANGYDYYVSTVNTPPTYGTTPTGHVGAGVTTAPLSSLPSGTQHFFWVRTDCDGSDKGAWSSSANFTTLVLTPSPWLEGFATAALPSSWAQTGWLFGLASGTYGSPAAAKFSGTPTAVVYKNLHSGATTGNFQTITVGPISSGDALSFGYKLINWGNASVPANGSGNFIVAISTDYGASYTNVQTVTNDGSTTDWQSYNYSLASYVGQNVRVRITGNWVSGDYYLAFDNFVIASCLPPSGLATSNMTPTSVDLSWTAPSPAPGFGYEYVVDNVATSPSAAANTGTDVAGTSITGFTVSPNTTYYLHVRSECTDGGDYSSWVNSAAFTTPCNPATIPYSQGFESGFTDATAVANCIGQESVAGAGVWNANSSQTIYNRTPRTGSFNATLIYSNNDWMFIPVTLVGSQSYDVSFFARQDGAIAANASVSASYGTVGTAAGMTNSIIASTGIINGDYQGFAGSFTPPSSGTYYVGINGTINGSPWYISIDDILIEESPACPKPTALSAVPALNSASLNWTDAGPATEWEIQYQIGGNFTPTTPNVLGIASHPHTIGSLTQQTTYTYYVRGNCGIDGPSDWAGPFSFTTLPCVPTYTTGKTEGDLLSRVRIIGTTLDNESGTAQTNPAYTFFTGQPQYTGTLNAGTSYDVEVSVGTWGGQGVAVWIDFDGDGLFETPSERIGYTTGTFGVGTGDLPIDPANTTTFPISLPCDPIPGTYRMRVRDVWNTGGQLIDPCINYGYGETEDYIVTVGTPPPCPAPSAGIASNIVYNGASLDWTIGCDELAWDVHVVTAGGGLTGAPSHPNASKPLVLNTLSASTAYHFYVRADCGGPVSSWVGPFAFTTPIAPPANDDCVNAIAFPTILPNNTCVSVSATTVGATGSLDATCFGAEDDDVWYTFTVPSGYTTLEYVNTSVSGSTDRMLQVLDACGGTSLGCYDPESGVLTGLTGGNTYYLRVYTYGTGVSTTLNICLRTPPPAPANDDCANAINFPTIPTNGNCVNVTATTVGATGSADVTCTGTEDDDVWYNFTVPVGYTSLLYTNTSISGTSSDRVLQVLDACGGTSLGCYDLESGSITGLTGGSTYKLRVYTWGSGVNTVVSICLRVPPPPPANDDCANAIAFPTILNTGACATVTASTESATGSLDATCFGAEDDDVWYTFTVPAGYTSLFYTNTTVSGSTDRMLQVLDACGGTSLGCYDPESGELTGLTGGSTYYLRVFTYGTGASTAVNVCLRVPPPPPANDDCSGATPLQIGVAATSTTEGATESVPAVSLCSGFTGNADDDVWFSFVAPSYPVNIFVSGVNAAAGIFDAVIDLRNGACDGTTVDCSDDGIVSEVLEEPSLVPGQTYYVRVYSFLGTPASRAQTFTILIVNAAPPANDNPAANSPVLNSPNHVYPNCMLYNGTTAGSTSSFDDEYNDVWYQFVAISNGVSIRTTSSFCDLGITLCNSSYAPILHVDVTGEGGNEILNYGGLVEGQTYYFAVCNNTDFGTDGPFTLCMQKLRKPNCQAVPANGYNLCSTFKSTATGAATTTFTFDNGTETSTTSANPITLSTPALALLYGQTYSVDLTANYALLNGAGATQNISVSNTNACSVTIGTQPAVDVKAAQRCPATLFRSGFLQAAPVGVGLICGVIGYNIEFTRAASCSDFDGDPLSTFVKTVNTATAQIALNTAFSDFPIGSNPNIGYWIVRWQPIFTGNVAGNWGNERIIAVNGTSAMEMEEDNSDSLTGFGYNDSNVSANLYPNPNNGDMVNLNMTGITAKDVHIRIMDGMGKVVYTNRYTVEGSLNTIVTFSKPLASGLYMVEFTSGSEVTTQRMMVAKQYKNNFLFELYSYSWL